MSTEQIKQSKKSFSRILKFMLTKKVKFLCEVILALIVSIMIGIVFSVYGRGGPNSSDVTLYMNVGLNGIKMPFILNRYFHVFMQAIFMKLASSPLKGYHSFWGFIMGSSCFLIYLSARKALKRSTPLHGFLAVLIFFSFEVIADFSGVIVVDFSAMLMILVFFTIYIISLNQEHKKPWLIGALGCILFLAFKTKETTLPVAILLIGLGWAGQQKFKISTLLKNLLYVVCGVLIGMIIFGILSWIFLGDPFFGLRVSEWQEYSATNNVITTSVLESMNSLGDGNLDDWYEGYWFEFTLLPFLFYIISGVTPSREETPSRKVLWLVPIMFAVFLIVSINNSLGFIERYGLPIMPILSILAPQFLDLEWPESKKRRRNYIIFLSVGLIIAVGIRVLLRLVIPPQGLDLGSIVTLIYYPLLISLLFISLFLFRDYQFSHILNFLIVLSLIATPIASNLRSIFLSQKNLQRFVEVVEPFSEIDEYIEYTPETIFYVTHDVFAQSPISIYKNIDELLCLFNIYYDADTTRESFYYIETPDDIASDILAEPYDYVLITMNNWTNMQIDQDQITKVHQNYELNISPTGYYVLLIHTD